MPNPNENENVESFIEKNMPIILQETSENYEKAYKICINKYIENRKKINPKSFINKIAIIRENK